MNNFFLITPVAVLSLTSPLLLAVESVDMFSSLERYDFQNGFSTTELRSYDGFDDVSGTSIAEESFNGTGEYYAVNLNAGDAVGIDQQIAYSQFYQ